MRTRSPKQLSAAENVKTTINWFETLRNSHGAGHEAPNHVVVGSEEVGLVAGVPQLPLNLL